jgi:hypothetical protein
MIEVIATVSAASDTLGSLREMVSELDRFAVEDTAPLLDGGHVLHESTGVPVGETAGSLRSFVKALESEADDLAIHDGRLVTLELDVLRVGFIECGSHVKELPSNILVEVHPSCKDC